MSAYLCDDILQRTLFVNIRKTRVQFLIFLPVYARIKLRHEWAKTYDDCVYMEDGESFTSPDFMRCRASPVYPSRLDEYKFSPISPRSFDEKKRCVYFKEAHRNNEPKVKVSVLDTVKSNLLYS